MTPTDTRDERDALPPKRMRYPPSKCGFCGNLLPDYEDERMAHWQVHIDAGEQPLSAQQGGGTKPKEGETHKT